MTEGEVLQLGLDLGIPTGGEGRVDVERSPGRSSALVEVEVVEGALL